MVLIQRRRPKATKEEPPDVLAELRPRYTKAVRELAACLMKAAAANAALEELQDSVALLDARTRSKFPPPWLELHRGKYMGAATRIDLWLALGHATGFLG